MNLLDMLTLFGISVASLAAGFTGYSALRTLCARRKGKERAREGEVTGGAARSLLGRLGKMDGSMDEAKVEEEFNAALDFALDEADGDGLLFLRMWREGDWDGIQRDFPDFRSPNGFSALSGLSE